MLTLLSVTRRSAAGGVGSLLVLVILVGCAPTEPQIPRVPVFGVVTLGSNPLSAATISFLPNGPGPSATTGITNGHYQFTEENGPTAGLHRVVITRVIIVKERNKFDKSPALANLRANWELKAEVLEPVETSLDFDLK